MADYAMQELSFDLNKCAAQLARAATDAVATKDKPRAFKSWRMVAITWPERPHTLSTFR